MPASKLTRVRSDGFSNNSAITRPGSSGSRSPCAVLGLQVLGDREDPLDFGGGQIGDRNEVSHEQESESECGFGVRHDDAGRSMSRVAA